jgi:hypothetical protein
MTRDRDDDIRDADIPEAAPTPEATGSLPLTMTPSGAPAGLGMPVDEAPEDTRRLGLWVAVGVVVLIVLVALIVWL